MKYAEKNPVLGAIVYNIMFGLGYLPLKVVTTHLNSDATLLIAYRFGLCLLGLKLLQHCGKIELKSIRQMGWAVLPLGIVQLLKGFLETVSLQYYPSGKASVVMALIPLFSTLIAIPIFHEKPSKGQFAFILVSFWGASIVTKAGDDVEATTLGFILVLLATLMASLMNICIRKLGASFSSMDIAYALAWVMLVVYGPVTAVRHIASRTVADMIRPLADPVVIGGLFFLSIVISLYSVCLRTMVFTNLPMASAASFSGISTITAVLAGILLLHETFGLREIIGIALVLFGVMGVNEVGKKEPCYIKR